MQRVNILALIVETGMYKVPDCLVLISRDRYAKYQFTWTIRKEKVTYIRVPCTERTRIVCVFDLRGDAVCAS